MYKDLHGFKFSCVARRGAEVYLRLNDQRIVVSEWKFMTKADIIMLKITNNSIRGFGILSCE